MHLKNNHWIKHMFRKSRRRRFRLNSTPAYKNNGSSWLLQQDQVVYTEHLNLQRRLEVGRVQSLQRVSLESSSLERRQSPLTTNKRRLPDCLLARLLPEAACSSCYCFLLCFRSLAGDTYTNCDDPKTWMSRLTRSTISWLNYYKIGSFRRVHNKIRL